MEPRNGESNPEPFLAGDVLLMREGGPPVPYKYTHMAFVLDAGDTLVGGVAVPYLTVAQMEPRGLTLLTMNDSAMIPGCTETFCRALPIKAVRFENAASRTNMTLIAEVMLDTLRLTRRPNLKYVNMTTVQEALRRGPRENPLVEAYMQKSGSYQRRDSVAETLKAWLGGEIPNMRTSYCSQFCVDIMALAQHLTEGLTRPMKMDLSLVMVTPWKFNQMVEEEKKKGRRLTTLRRADVRYTPSIFPIATCFESTTTCPLKPSRVDRECEKWKAICRTLFEEV